MITNPNVRLPEKSMDAYEVQAYFSLPTIEQAVEKIKREGWIFAGYNEFGQEVYLDLRKEVIDNLRKFGYTVEDKCTNCPEGFRELHEFEGWYLNCEVYVLEDDFSDELYDLYWFGE
jgi:hypothetical protein